VPNGNGYYHIFNYKYPAHRLRKWGPQDHKTSFTSKAGGSEQLWKLVPRYTPTLSAKVLAALDNRQNSKDVRKFVETYVGLKRTSTRRITHKTNFKLGLSRIFKKLLSVGIDHTMEFINEEVREKKWHKIVRYTYTVGAGMNFKLVQQVATLKSVMPKDSVTLYSYAKMFVSNTSVFEDPDGFIPK